jgi:pimeloyl-ACP methyl ester carboxylesterase
MRSKVEMKTVKVPGATLYYEIQGSGPILVCIPGGPTDAGVFADLAGRLADRYTVVAYDPRGHSRSAVDAEPQDIPVAVHADDAAALIGAAGGGPAYVYGSSGGGTIGLELVTRHPDLVRMLVAHEAPLMELLPDAERWRAAFADIHETYFTQGVYPAMGKFAAVVEEGGPKYSEEMQRAEPTPQGREMGVRMEGNFSLFLAHEIRQIGGYLPDVDAPQGHLDPDRQCRGRDVRAAGRLPGGLRSRRAPRYSGHPSPRLARRLGL